MSLDRTRRIIIAALLLGLLGDIVSRGPFWPTGFAVCVIASAIVFLIVGGERPFALIGEEGGKDRVVLAGTMILAASALMLRSAPTLWFFDMLTLLGAAGLLVWRMGGRALTEFRPIDLPITGVRTGVAMAIGFPALLFGGEEATERGAAKDPRRAWTIAIGVLLALPPVILIAALLGESDPVFGKFMQAWVGPNLEEAIGHALTTAFITWPVAGWLRAASRPSKDGIPEVVDQLPKFDFLGIAPALYAISGLLALYLAFQARALFGGQAYVEATSGLTYAEYARHGFFELVAVTAIVLGVLLIADGMIDQQNETATRRFRSTGWVVVALVVVLMVSALQRMWVYVSFFGLSDTRLYATAGMTWLGVVIGWFGWTVLRGRRTRFGFGLLVASAAWVAALNVINPEAVVVRVNVARLVEGKSFDVIYHGHLSADATAALVDAAPKLGAGDCRGLLMLVYDDHAGTMMRDSDWSTWQAPVSRATRLLNGSQEEFLGRHCPAVPAVPAPPPSDPVIP